MQNGVSIKSTDYILTSIRKTTLVILMEKFTRNNLTRTREALKLQNAGYFRAMRLAMRLRVFIQDFDAIGISYLPIARSRRLGIYR